MIKNCKKHGEVEHALEPKTGYYRCKRCRNNHVIERRRQVKLKLVQAFGGKCQTCGYSKCPGVLQFHHLIPEQKTHNVSCKGSTKSYDKLLIEAKKCILLCANCHAEIENKFIPTEASQ